MSNADDFRTRAAELRADATRESDDVVKDELEDLARRYIACAEQAEQRDQTLH
jgi:hypothetical protein